MFDEFVNLFCGVGFIYNCYIGIINGGYQREAMME